MAFTKLIAFDRPLTGVVLQGGQGRLCNEVELAELAEAAYRRGVDATRAAADQQMVEFRHDMEQLSDGVLKRLSEVEPELLNDIREALPGLAVEIGRRLLAGFEPPPEVIGRLCQEALEQLYPERQGLEITLSQRDAELLGKLNPDWMKRYPELRIRIDATLAPGDCQVRSRFGLTDARQETKLAALNHHLTGV
jgi:flagellar assembly protein FliH